MSITDTLRKLFEKPRKITFSQEGHKLTWKCDHCKWSHTVIEGSIAEFTEGWKLATEHACVDAAASAR